MSAGRTSDRFAGIEEAATTAVTDTVRRLRREGASVCDLGGGDSDFATPTEIIDAAEDSMRAGFTHYAPARGIDPLLDAVSRKFANDNGLQFDPATEILITPSAKFAVYAALLAVLNPGDEVLVPSPSWVSYGPMVSLIGGVPVQVASSPAQHFQIDGGVLRAHVTPRTRVIIANSPNNPTGHVLSGEEIASLVDLAIEYDLLIISDEIYEKLTYDGAHHVSIAGWPGAADRTVTVNGFSKAYAMTGWRLGYLAGPAEIVRQATMGLQHTVGCAASFVQPAAVVALERGGPWIEAMVGHFARRRRLMVTGLNSLRGVVCEPPEGAFYAFANIEGVGRGDSVEFCKWLLTEVGVAVTPGSAFGPGGEGHVRVCFAKSDDVVSTAISRMVQHFS